MTKKLSPNDPLRPRNIRKREKREARKTHKQIMAKKKEAEEAAKDGQPQQAIDKNKVFHADVVRQAKERIARMKEKIPLPLFIQSLRRGKVSKVLVINRDGKRRELLPDRPDRHVILCHGRVAKVIRSSVCVFNKVTEHEEIDEEKDTRRWIDGSWTLAPCTPAMLRGTTVQHVSRRRWWFLHRYWYQISFDGRVQPAGMFFDYDIDPACRSQEFFVTHEYVKVEKYQDRENDFLRFWLRKENITPYVPPKRRRRN